MGTGLGFVVLGFGSRRRAFGLGADLLLVFLVTIVGLLICELAYRAWRDPRLLLHWQNFVAENRRPKPGQEFLYDEIIGYVGNRNVRADGETTDANGFRMTSAGRVSGPPVPGSVLAIGDSFAYGMDVQDSETWPAILQERTGWPTINAGVKGYGFDQSVLNAERLAKQTSPGVIVISFITDDFRRSEARRVWNIPKPYFEVVHGEAVLRNVPVPQGDNDTLTFWERALGWSALAAKFWPVLQHVADEKFGYRERALPEGAGEQVACALTRHLAAIGVPVLVVAQYDPRPWTEPQRDRGSQHRQAQDVLECARAANLLTLDTFDAIDAAVRSQGYERVYGEVLKIHHSGYGNGLVADQIAAALARIVVASEAPPRK